jgi:hypothetical protein
MKSFASAFLYAFQLICHLVHQVLDFLERHEVLRVHPPSEVGGGRVVPVKIRKAPPTVKKCTKADIE